MNYCFNWLIVYLYRNGLIDREKFISSWKTVQHVTKDSLIFSYVSGQYKRFYRPVKKESE